MGKLSNLTPKNIVKMALKVSFSGIIKDVPPSSMSHKKTN